MNIKNILFGLIIISTLFLSSVSVYTEPSDTQTTTTFNYHGDLKNIRAGYGIQYGYLTRAVTFPYNGGTDTSAKLVLPKNSKVSACSFDIKAVPVNTIANNATDIILVVDNSHNMYLDYVKPNDMEIPFEKFINAEQASDLLVDLMIFDTSPNYVGKVNFGTTETGSWFSHYVTTFVPGTAYIQSKTLVFQYVGAMRYTPLTQNEDTLKNLKPLSLLETLGQVNVPKGLNKANDLLNYGENPRKIIILLSDGNPDTYRSRFSTDYHTEEKNELLKTIYSDTPELSDYTPAMTTEDIQDMNERMCRIEYCKNPTKPSGGNFAYCVIREGCTCPGTCSATLSSAQSIYNNSDIQIYTLTYGQDANRGVM